MADSQFTLADAQAIASGVDARAAAQAHAPDPQVALSLTVVGLVVAILVIGLSWRHLARLLHHQHQGWLRLAALSGPVVFLGVEACAWPGWSWLGLIGLLGAPLAVLALVQVIGWVLAGFRQPHP
jgi:predicted small integral membrane protein